VQLDEIARSPSISADGSRATSGCHTRSLLGSIVGHQQDRERAGEGQQRQDDLPAVQRYDQATSPEYSKQNSHGRPGSGGDREREPQRQAAP
jgi:hypothetical protein